MKNKIILILVLGFIFSSVSCNSGLTNEKAKEVFEKSNPGRVANSIVLKKLVEGSYLAKINFTFSSPGGNTFEFEYTFTKFDSGWTCTQNLHNYDPGIWK